jgi:hypothetical protein
MRKFVPPLALLFAGIFSLAASLPFLTTAKDRPGFYFFEAELTSSSPGNVQLFFDMGRGINEADSVSFPLIVQKEAALYRFPLPMGTCRNLRFDPTDREGVVTVAKARIVDQGGHVVRDFKPGDFHGGQQVASVTEENGRVKIVTTPAAFDAMTTINLGSPVKLALNWISVLRTLVPIWIGILLAILLVNLVVTSARPAQIFARVAAWAGVNPVKAILCAAVAAVTVHCHPVLFFGKSFVSPNNNVYLLYDTFPTVPGYDSTDLEDARGADVGAMMWQHLYYPVVARAALFTHGELPLWNRYDLCGIPLLGQGQSMFGDPLNWLTIAAKGATWAWDTRFLVIRVLFAFGTGLAVWLLVRHLGSALLITASSVFIGFFAFRFNHPAILSVCWSPWVLVAWCWLLEARTPRARNLSLLALIASHWCMMTSGTIKEGYMLAACLDLTGFLLVLTAAGTWRERTAKLGAALAASLVFILLSAPLWTTFLDALGKSQTRYDVPGASQLSPWLLIGFFEDLFYRQLRPGEAHFEPSSNFVVLFGVLWSLASLRETGTNRRFTAVLLATLVPLALVFGVVPADWIVRLPFIANIIHVDNTFSCPLLILTAVLAGFGLASAIRRLREPGWIVDFGFFCLLLAALTALYFGSTGQAPKSSFFHGYVPALFLAVLACPAGAWLAARRQQRGVLAVILAGGFVLLLWRHGQYLATPFDAYVLNPKVRVDLAAPSPAVALVNAQMKDPSRTVGLGYNLFPGFNQMYGWESIYGVDAVRNKYLEELAGLTPMKKVVDWIDGPIAQEDIKEALPMQDLMNVRHYLASHRPAARDLPGRRWLASLDLDVYESPTAWPRAFFTDTLMTYPAAIDFVHLTLNGDRRPFAAVQEKDLKTLPASARQLPRNPGARSVAPAYDYHLTSNTTSFTVAATEPGVIVLSESYYPDDFEVKLNDAPADYFRVNHAFKGVYVDHPGIYHVTFRYWPEHLTLGLWLCAAGIVIGSVAPALEWYLRQSRASRA